MKTISLLKAVLTQDMNMFKYKTTSKKKTKGSDKKQESEEKTEEKK